MEYADELASKAAMSGHFTNSILAERRFAIRQITLINGEKFFVQDDLLAHNNNNNDDGNNSSNEYEDNLDLELTNSGWMADVALDNNDDDDEHLLVAHPQSTINAPDPNNNDSSNNNNDPNNNDNTNNDPNNDNGNNGSNVNNVSNGGVRSKTSKDKSLLHRALTMSSSSKPRNRAGSHRGHECGVCGKSFKDRYSVAVHMRTHSGEKPFACSFCSKRFRQKAHLAKHKLTHLPKT